MDGSDGPATAAALGALRDPAAGVREAASTYSPAPAEGSGALLRVGRVGDADLHVRRMAGLALSEMPADEAAGAAVWAMATRNDNNGDPLLGEAAVVAAARNDLSFLRRRVIEAADHAARFRTGGLGLADRAFPGADRPDRRGSLSAVMRPARSAN